MDLYKRIHISPMGGNQYFRHHVVYLGKAIPCYSNSDVVNILGNQYVFIFSTYLNPKDGTAHGTTRINIFEEYQISHFAKLVIEQTHFHTFEADETKLVINDFVEINKIESDNGFNITATLKNQEICNYDGKVIYVKDKQILLVRENLKFENESPLTLGKEFDLQVKLDRYDDLSKDIDNCISKVRNLAINNSDDEEKAAIELVNKKLQEELDKVNKVRSVINSFEEI